MLDYPLTKPVSIFIAGSELLGWTEMSLRRSKKEMTGDLSVSVFFTHLPRNMQLRQAVAGAEITVYVGGHLAFTGTLDKRHSKGGKHGPTTKGAGQARAIGRGNQVKGGGMNVHIGPNDYTITLRARGKTKSLIDSSHDHPTGQISNAKTRPVAEKLIESHRIPLEWLAPVYDMDKARFRDGGLVKSELQRLASEHGYWMHETRDGKLRVTADTGRTIGEPLILGQNILEFSAEQSEEPKNTQIKVKGQRTKKGVRGRDAVEREKTVQIGSQGGKQRHAPLTIQHYTDGTDEALERRAKHEGDLQQQDSKSVRIDVFHVMSRAGMPWDIGNVHYVEIPTEGIYEPMECTELTYVVAHDRTLKTQLIMNPLPGAGANQGAGVAGLPSLNLGSISGAVNALLVHGAARRAAMGAEYAADLYPESWGPATFSVLSLAAGAFSLPAAISQAVAALPIAGPPLTLTGAIAAVKKVARI